MFKLKKNLVIAAVGDQSLHRHWIDENEYRFDTVLVYYGDGEGYGAEKPTFYFEKKGSKFHIVDQILSDIGDIIEKYDYIWIPDDDIYLEKHDLLRFFQFMGNYNLEIAQPSLIGWYGVDMNLHRKGSLLRYTNWVEIMCPCFSRSALLECRDTFRENECGWGIEGIWNVRLGHPRDKIAIIDDVVAVHTRPVFGGDIYKTGNPQEEAMNQALKVCTKYNLAEEFEKDLEFGEPTNGEVYCSVVYKQINKDMEFDIKKPDRFWPPCDFIKNWKPPTS